MLCPLIDKCRELNQDTFTCYNPSFYLDNGCDEYKKRKRNGNKTKKRKQINIKK